jgi:hypothetical protein
VRPHRDARGRQDTKRKAPAPGHVERTVFLLTAYYTVSSFDVGVYVSREAANEAQQECRDRVQLPNGATMDLPNYFKVKQVTLYEPLDEPERKRARHAPEGAPEAEPERALFSFSVGLVRELRTIVAEMMDVSPWPAPFKELQDLYLPEV